MENEDDALPVPLLSTKSSSSSAIPVQKNSSSHLLRQVLFLLSCTCNSYSMIICILISSVLQITCSYLSFKSQLLLSGVVGSVLDGNKSEALGIVVNAGFFYATLALLQVLGSFFSEHVRLGVRVRLELFLHKFYFGAHGRPYRMIVYQDNTKSSTSSTSSSPPLTTNRILDNVDLRITQDVDQLSAQACAFFLGSYAMPSSALGTIASLVITFSALLSPERSGSTSTSGDITTLPLPALFLALLLFTVSAFLSHFLATRVARTFYTSDSSIGTLRFAYAKIRLFFDEISLLLGQEGEEKRVKRFLEDAFNKTRWLFFWQFAQSSFSSFSAQAPYLLAYAVAILSLPLYLDADGDVNVSAVSAAVSISGQFIASIAALPYLWGEMATLSGYLSRVSDLVDALDRDKEGKREEEEGDKNDDMRNLEGNSSSVTQGRNKGPPKLLHFDSSSTYVTSPLSLQPGTQIRVPLQMGQSFLITGPSGIGKTSSLRWLAGLEETGGELGEGIKKFNNQVVFIPQRPYFPIGTLYEGIVACSTASLELISLNNEQRENTMDRVIKEVDEVLRASETTTQSRKEVLKLLNHLKVRSSSSSSSSPSHFSSSSYLFTWMFSALKLIRNPTLLNASLLSQISLSSSFPIPSIIYSGMKEELIPTPSEVISCLEEIGLKHLVDKEKGKNYIPKSDLSRDISTRNRIIEREEDESSSCDWMRILSAGELQLLLIASSVLLRRPQYISSSSSSSSPPSSSSLFVFLDEATSALDVTSRERVMKALDRLGVTIMSFSHNEKGDTDENSVKDDNDAQSTNINDKRFSHTIKIPVIDEVSSSSSSSSSSSPLLSEEKKAFQDATLIYLEKDEDNEKYFNNMIDSDLLSTSSSISISGSSSSTLSHEDSTSLFQCLAIILLALSPTRKGISKGLSSSLSYLFSNSYRDKHRPTFYHSSPSTLSSLFSPNNDLGFILILIGVIITSISLSMVSLQVAFIPGAIFDAIIEGNTSLAWNWFFYALIVYICSALLGAFSRTLGKLVALSSFYRLVHYVQRRYLKPGMPPYIQLVNDVKQSDREMKSTVISPPPPSSLTATFRTNHPQHHVPPLWALHNTPSNRTSSSISKNNTGSPSFLSSSSSSSSTEKMKIDSLDQRLIGDTYSLTTSICTVFFGGDNRLSLIQVLSTVIATSATTSSRYGSSPVLICFVVAAVSVFLSAISSFHLPRAIALVALAEGALRSAHVRVRTFAEEIGFLRLEKSEKERTDALLLSVAAVGVNAIFIELPPRLLNNIFALSGTAIAYGIVTYATIVNDASTLFGLVYLLSTLIMYLTSFPSYYTSFIESSGYMRRVSALLQSIEQVSFKTDDDDKVDFDVDPDAHQHDTFSNVDTADITSIDISLLNLRNLKWKSSSPPSSSSSSLPQPLHFSLKRGGLVCITGPSSCGKTSLVRSLVGLEDQLSGTSPLSIKAYKRSHTSQQHEIFTRMQLLTVVPQRSYILPFGSSLADNIAYPMVIESWEGEKKKNEISRLNVLEAIKNAGLTYLLDRHVDNPSVNSIDSETRAVVINTNENDNTINNSFALTARQQSVVFKRNVIDWSRTLSGGERQRVAIARLLFKRPPFAILDEAFNALPHSEGRKLLNLLREKNIGVILLSSSMSE